MEEPDVFLIFGAIVSYFGARILHFGNSIIHETIIPNLSVPPGHAAAGSRQACGGRSRYRGPDVRSLF